MPHAIVLLATCPSAVSETSSSIKVPEELDWMGEEGALEKEIAKALRHHEKCLAQGQLALTQAICYICGLSDDDALLECEPTWLFGNANDGTSWPSRPLTTTQAAKPAVEGNERSWWKLW